MCFNICLWILLFKIPQRKQYTIYSLPKRCFKENSFLADFKNKRINFRQWTNVLSHEILSMAVAFRQEAQIFILFFVSDYAMLDLSNNNVMCLFLSSYSLALLRASYNIFEWPVRITPDPFYCGAEGSKLSKLWVCHRWRYNYIFKGHGFLRLTVYNITQCHFKCKDDCLCVSMIISLSPKKQLWV